MENKVIGYLLVLVGVVLIIFTAFSVFNVFTKRTEPINIVSEESLFLPQSGDKSTITNLMNIDMKEIAYLSNLTFNILLAGFFLNVGFKISSIGAMLARPIVVDLKSNSQKPV